MGFPMILSDRHNVRFGLRPQLVDATLYHKDLKMECKNVTTSTTKIYR